MGLFNFVRLWRTLAHKRYAPQQKCHCKKLPDVELYKLVEFSTKMLKNGVGAEKNTFVRFAHAQCAQSKK